MLNQNGKAEFFIQGNLDNPNHTLYLNNFRKQEVGRLFSDGAGLIASFTIDVVNHSLVGVKKLNTPTANIFYLTQLKYIVTGSIKRGYLYFSFWNQECSKCPNNHGRSRRRFNL